MANAGTEGVVSPIEIQTYENWQQVLNVNVIGVWLSMKYCVAPMKAAQFAAVNFGARHSGSASLRALPTHVTASALWPTLAEPVTPDVIRISCCN